VRGLAIYRVFAGYHIVNLSIDLKPSRTPRNDSSQHDLVVVVGLGLDANMPNGVAAVHLAVSFYPEQSSQWP
jgi:hypothetical protein